MDLAPASAVVSIATTPISLLLLGLVVLNALALGRPQNLLSRAPAAALLVPLLVPLSLPIRENLLQPLLQTMIPLLVLLLLGGLLRPAPTPAQRAAAPQSRNYHHDFNYPTVAILASLGLGLLFALRPAPFEYPGDSTSYLQTFVESTLEQPGPISCLVTGWRLPTYQNFCTLWSVVVQTGHLNAPLLLSGIPQRLTLMLEITVLGLSYFRLLQAARIKPLAAALAWLLVGFGLGNQAIAFLINNGLQGSILAAAIFLEAVMVMLWLLSRPSPSRWQAGFVVASLIGFTLLELKLHGAFALTTLLLLVPMAGLLGAARLWGHGVAGHPLASLPKPTARQLLLASLTVLTLVLSFKTGWMLQKQTRTVVPWTFLHRFGWPSQALPGSYLLRSPGSRPETLAVASLVIGFWQLASSWRPGPASPMATASGNQPRGNQRFETSPRDDGESQLYPFLASLYGLGVVMAFLVPPLSHLYINLPYEIISNYRLMWGCILFSPLPCLLDRALSHRALSNRAQPWAARGIAALVAALVLIPIPSGSKTYPQRFWSKSSHILRGPSTRVDLVAVAAALMPSLEALSPTVSPGPVVVLADELIGSALAPYQGLALPIHPTRVTAGTNLTNWETHGLLRAASTDAERLRVLREIKTPPLLIIQESSIGNYYSPYGEINVYDKDIIARLTSSAVNRLNPDLLKAAGFESWRWLDARGQPMAAPSQTKAADAGGTTAQATYQIWKRIQTPPGNPP
jgi:hypothetical protein